MEDPSLEMTPTVLLGFGLLLGVRHALDADHVVAVSTIVTRHRRLGQAALVGLLWGVGHTITLLAAGLALLLFRWTLPPALTLSFELAAGVLLVGLGLETVRGFRRKQVHLHRHDHGSAPHVHFHSHRADPSHAHGHAPPSAGRPLLLGLAHGLAGSAALTLLALSTVASLWQGLLFISVFGIGSILGMMAVSLLIGLPFALTPGRLARVHQAIRLTAGLASTALGLSIVWATGLALLGGS